MGEYEVVTYENLDKLTSLLDIPYQYLEKQLSDARAMEVTCVYFRRYTGWHMVFIDNRIPVDWFMALVLR